MMLAMAFILLWLGLYPQPVISSARQSLDNLNRIVTKTGLKISQKDIKGLEGTHLMQVEQAKDKHLQSLKEPGDRP